MTTPSKLFHQNFTLVVLGQIISLFGNSILRFALPLYLLDRTGSATLFGAVSACAFVPMIILSPVGGIIADRLNKRNIMVALDFITAALIGLFALSLGQVDLVISLIITLMLLYGIQGAYQPAVQASLPLLVAPSQLLTANAIINQVSALSNLIGPVLGGVLYGFYGLEPIVLIGGICFFCSAVMELFIRIPHTKRAITGGIWSMVRQDLAESITFIRHDKPIIWKMMLLVATFNCFLSALLIVALPVLITQTLGLSSQLYGYAQGALAAGGLLGGILTGIFAKHLNIRQMHLLLLGTALCVLPIGLVLSLAFSPMLCYLVITLCSFLMMILVALFSVQILTFIQSTTPPQLIGKVISCVLTLALCAQPLGQAMYGVLFDQMRNAPHLIIFGAALASALIALASKRILRNLATAEHG